jgi:hypothetical protein
VADGVRHAFEDGGRVGRLNSYESGDSTHERRGGLDLTLACGCGEAGGMKIPAETQSSCHGGVVVERAGRSERKHCPHEWGHGSLKGRSTAGWVTGEKTFGWVGEGGGKSLREHLENYFE